MKNKRVILDTNLWNSFLISKKLSQIDGHLDNHNIILIFSNELIEEFVNMVNRPKFKSYFTPKDIEKVLECFD
ncbi:putative PIN family toxin of toxin-antitoxin system [Gelidibacter algens]|uniref:Putative PIN family toxin of toxin-antitoxin system n=1 Tax=Gelidibacter algens TaxID=49280 RepID=A0A327S9V0_9FLAO|nr:putative PIN family toxin of toxin-antitoxin system [Gelidibacter algens]